MEVEVEGEWLRLSSMVLVVVDESVDEVEDEVEVDLGEAVTECSNQVSGR